MKGDLLAAPATSRQDLVASLLAALALIANSRCQRIRRIDDAHHRCAGGPIARSSQGSNGIVLDQTGTNMQGTGGSIAAARSAGGKERRRSCIGEIGELTGVRQTCK